MNPFTTLLLALLLTQVAAFQGPPSIFGSLQVARLTSKMTRKRKRSRRQGRSDVQALPTSKNEDGSEKKDRTVASKTQLSASAAASMSMPRFRIFCDLDGVLCDFDASVRSLSQGVPANNLPSRKLWSLVHKADRFYERLPWTRDGRRLWNSIRHYEPNILTGVSMGKGCPEEKARWCRRELGVETNHVHKAARASRHTLVKGQHREGVVNVITCWSRNKHFESGHQAVLIDDRIALKDDWVAKGGIFVHHTDTERTLEQLRAHGIIDHEEEEPSPKKQKAKAARTSP